MLAKQGRYNDLSAELRTELEKSIREIKSKKVIYRFHIETPNDDPQRKEDDPKVIFPSLWTLPQRTFTIQDRDGGYKEIAIVKEFKNGRDGEEYKIGKIQLRRNWVGFLTVKLDTQEGREMFAFLELHPKNKNGIFASQFKDETVQMFFRVDELKEATRKRQIRAMKNEALLAASAFTDQEVWDFASAMAWDETEDITILKDRVEEMAETLPEDFIKVINGGTMSWRALAKRALDKNIITLNALEGKLEWPSGEMIGVLDFSAVDKSPVERIADWLMGHKNGDKVTARIKQSLGQK